MNTVFLAVRARLNHLAQPMTLTGTLPNATAGAAYTGTLTLGGTFTAPVTIDASAGSIPSWMTPTVSGNTVTFSGTAPASAETDTFTVRATDSSATPQVATSDQVVQVSEAPASGLVQAVTKWFGSPTGPSTLTLNKAPTAGNLLLMAVYVYSGPSLVPSGWTLVPITGLGGNSIPVLYYRISDGTEESIVLPTSTGNTQCSISVQEWHGSNVGAFGKHVVISGGVFDSGAFTAPSGAMHFAGFTTIQNGARPIAVTTGQEVYADAANTNGWWLASTVLENCEATVDVAGTYGSSSGVHANFLGAWIGATP